MEQSRSLTLRGKRKGRETMNIQKAFLTGLILAAGAALSGVFPAAAEVRPSSDLLLPWFEVDLEGGAHTTLFALANSSAEPVDVLVSVRTSWGIPVLNLTLTLAGGQTETADLRDWLVLGRLPSGALGSGELAHVQAALAGRASPRDGLYYASPPAVAGRIAGSITFRAEGVPRPDALWGDFILSDTDRGSALAEGLVNVDLMVEPRLDCSRHGLRFLTGHQAEMASELWLWTRLLGEPSATPEIPETSRIHAIAEVFDEAGRRLATHDLELPPVARINLLDLAGNEPFGRIDLSTGEDSFAGVVVRDEHGMAMLLPAACLPDRTGPGLRLDVLVNGEEASAPPGPSLTVGEAIDWRYVVTNTGDVPLSGILVSDARGIELYCPGEVLAPGESMACNGTSTALACQQEIAVEAAAVTPAGAPAAAGGSAFYFGGTYGRAAIDIETSIAGVDADVPPGPSLENINPSLVSPYAPSRWWEYHVQNTGTLPLSDVTVSDERGPILYCYKNELAPGESTNCGEEVWPGLGLHHKLSKAAGVASCGLRVEDQDSTYYFGVKAKTVRIGIKTLVAGYDASVAPGPIFLVGDKVLWTYVVVNSAEAPLLDIWVTENERHVTCPKTGLLTGESMICTSTLDILPGPQQSEVRVMGFSVPLFSHCPQCHWSSAVSASDLSYYFGAAPWIDLEVSVNGEDADAQPGPEIPEGSPVEWTYTVTNKGNVDLTLVKILDEQGVEVAGCPVSYLTPGASASCSVTGEAAAGPQQRTATVTGTPFAGPVYPTGSWTGPPVTDSDTTWYTGVPPSP